MSRGIVILLALILTVAAGWLWLRADESHPLAGDGRPSHGEVDPQDREALREILREEDVR